MSATHLPPLSLDYGATVFYRGKRHVIRQESQDFATVVLFDPETGKLVEAAILDLSPAAPLAASPQKDLNAHGKERLAEAERKFDMIKPLLDKPGRTKQEVMARAAAAGVHYATLYKWLRAFETTGKVTAFVRRDRVDKGKSLLSAATEKIVSDTIEAIPLQQPSNLIDGALADKVYSMSEGYIGEISRLLEAAAVDAVESGVERIDKKRLDRIGWVAPSERRKEPRS